MLDARRHGHDVYLLDNSVPSQDEHSMDMTTPGE